MHNLNVHQLCEPGSYTYSYLLWDPTTLDAAIIDPVRAMVGRDLKLIRELGLTLRYTLETHIHSDHITGSGLLRQTLDSLVMLHENCGSKYADVLLRDGDRIPLGSGKITVIHTPGHTDSDISYLVPGIAFTGDTLLIRSCGRTDYSSGNAGVLFDSINSQLFSLPDHTRVYPGHDYNGFSCSTIGEEKLHNPRIGNGMTRERFITVMNNLRMDPPRAIHEAVSSNLRCGMPGSEAAVIRH